jgi:hypothetical protein
MLPVLPVLGLEVSHRAHGGSREKLRGKRGKRAKGGPLHFAFLIGLLPICINYGLVIPTAAKDLIITTVGLPLFCHDYYLVILEGSMGGAISLLVKRSAPLPFSPTFLLRLP